MSLLLAPDEVALFSPGAADPHGWVSGEWTDPVWIGAGNLQAAPGRSDSSAGDGGGHGPSDPASGATGILYLPEESEPADGMGALVRGTRYVLSQVRLTKDPGLGLADCYTASVTGADRWQSGGA